MLTPPEYELLISSISHEIRNPVTLINSYLQLMASLHPEVRQYAQWQPLQTELGYLCRLLSDISELHNSGHLQIAAVDANQWLKEYAASAKALVQTLAEPGTLFTDRLDAGLPMLSMDSVKIRQVLDNLIRNSIEAAEGPNTITLSASKDGQYLKIQVSDTGCGIPMEDLSSIFHPFVSHKSQGSGLGLAISHRIAQAHDGELLVHSVPGQGTVFTLCLPVSI